MSEGRTYLAHARALLVLGLPIVGSNLAQMALHVTDTVLMGWYGVKELAAVVLGTSFFFTFFILGSGFGIAVMGMVASALGRGDEVQVRRETRMGLWLSILYGIAIMPAMWFSRPILIAIGQDAEVATLAQDFLRIAGLGMVPALLIVVLKSYLAALERTQVMLWVTLGGVVLNVGLAWALIFGHWGAPALGVRGAAIASFTIQMLTCFGLALYAALSSASRRFRLFQRFWRPDWPAFRQVLRLGLPVGLTGLAESGLFVAAAMMMGWIGTVQLAAHGIAMEIAAIAFMVHLGVSNAATVRVGRAEGEGDGHAMRQIGVSAIALSLGFGALVVTLFLLAPHPLIGVFLDRSKPEAADILAFGTTLLSVAALFQFFDAMQVVALGLLRGVQDTRLPMWIAAFSYWGVGIPTSYILGFTVGLGGVGLWLGLVVGLVFAATLLLLRFWTGPWLAVRATQTSPT